MDKLYKKLKSSGELKNVGTFTIDTQINSIDFGYGLIFPLAKVDEDKLNKHRKEGIYSMIEF